MARRQRRDRDDRRRATRRPLVRGAALALAPVVGAGWSSVASAQLTEFLYYDTSIVQPAIPDGFDRGRNVSVTEKPRPDFDPTGIPLASFNVFPSLNAALGATSNVFLAQRNTRTDGYADINPAVTANSDWSRHSLTFNASADTQQYFSNGRRDQTNWNLGTTGRLDITDEINLTADADVARQFESPYSGGTNSTSAVLSNFLSGYLGLRGVYESGQFRGQVAIDRTTLDFATIDLGNGADRNQSNRNRHILRYTGQAEYAFTPTISIYAQGTYSTVDYTRDLAPGVPNRTSSGYRIVGGVNFDLASFMRGTVAAGYVRRNYDSPIYQSVSGPSVEAKLEYFPSDLTTVTLRLRRFLEDSGIGANTAFFDNQVALRVDHELLTNLQMSLDGEYGRVDYQHLNSAHKNTYRIIGAAQYQATNRYGLKGTMSYGRQIPDSALSGQRFTEVVGQIGFYLQI